MPKVNAKYRVDLFFNGNYRVSMVNTTHEERLRWEAAIANAEPFTINMTGNHQWYTVNPFNLCYITWTLQE